MDEYIKREDAIKAITYVGTADPTDIIPLTLYTAQKKIREIPAAYVAPKSEVAILNVQLAALEKQKYELQRELDKYKGVEKFLDDNMGRMIKEAIDKNKQDAVTEVLDELLNKLELISVVAEPRDGFMQGAIKTFNKTAALIAELKKKYTEEKE